MLKLLMNYCQRKDEIMLGIHDKWLLNTLVN